MPAVSQAQRRLMFAAKEGKVPSITPAVGAEFVNASKGVTGLPDHVKKAKGRLKALNAKTKPK